MVWIKKSLKFALYCLKSYQTEILTVQKSSCYFWMFYYGGRVMEVKDLLREEVANSTWWLLEMQRKGPLNLSVKLEWLCLQHRQAWSRPQSPVKWESVETGQGWMLRWGSSVERTYRECERPGTAEGGGQNQPVCTSTVLWEPVSSITTRPVKLTYPRN